MSALRIFVSHSHRDNAFCQALVGSLRAAGADVWYDEHDFGFGRIRKKIEEELLQRQLFILILSPASLQSDWVRDETEWFYDISKKSREYILPVVAERLAEDDIWVFLRLFKRIEQAAGIPFSQAEAIEQTLKTLGLTLDGESSPPPFQPEAVPPINAYPVSPAFAPPANTQTPVIPESEAPTIFNAPYPPPPAYPGIIEPFQAGFPTPPLSKQETPSAPAFKRFLEWWRDKSSSQEKITSPGFLLVINPGPLPLAPGAAIALERITTIGRAWANTIVLEDNRVSEKHARITYHNRQWWVEDLGSINKTFLNGSQLPEGVRVPTRSGDLLALGPLDGILAFKFSQAAHAFPVMPSNLPRPLSFPTETVQIDISEGFKQALLEAQQGYAQPLTPPPVPPTVPPMPQAVLRLRRRIDQDGPEQIYRLDRKIIQIGRHLSNDIVVHDKRASRYHAQIRYEENGSFIIYDLGSINGIGINGVTVRQHILRDGDLVSIGSYDFIFHVRL